MDWDSRVTCMGSRGGIDGGGVEGLGGGGVEAVTGCGRDLGLKLSVELWLLSLSLSL